jgi:hypothetical protein
VSTGSPVLLEQVSLSRSLFFLEQVSFSCDKRCSSAP